MIKIPEWNLHHKFNLCWFVLQVATKETKAETPEKEEPKFKAFTGKSYSLKG